jgi:hypothetical protein
MMNLIAKISLKPNKKSLRSNSIRVRKREKIIKKEREEEKKRDKERHR